MSTRLCASLVVTASMIALGCDQQGEARATTRTEVGAKREPSGSKAAPSQAAVLADGAKPAEPMIPDPTQPDLAGPAQPTDDRPDEQAPPPEEPAPPVAPADYGVIKPSLPLPDPSALTRHGLAGYEVVAIHDKPDGESSKLGYLRLGTRLMVGEKQSGPGCPKGWHALPQGGFACASKGLVVGEREPPLPNPPPSAHTEQALPYDYAYVKRWNSPMWWRVPTPEEVTAAEVIRTTREQQRLADEAAAKGLPPPTTKPKATEPKATEPKATEPKATEPKATEPKATAGDAAKDGGTSLPSVDDDDSAPPKADANKSDAKSDANKSDANKSDATKSDATKSDATKSDAKADAKPDATKSDATKPEPEAPVAPIALPLKPEKSWLERGFYISVGEKIAEEGRTWWHTARGGYVDVTHAYKYDAKDHAGIPLTEGATFPFGFVMVDTTKVFDLQADGKMTAVGTLEKRAFVDLDEEIEVAGKTYMTTVDGHMIRKADLRMADPQPLPKGLQPWERWVDVSLEKQILVAYEGERPVFTSLVSTGKKGSADEPFVTPTGRWRIRSKHISTTMDGNTASDGNYSIQDVPWTMFFEGSYALHGAFWHQGFGRPRSHGCVNLGPSAARWLFYWTTPFLPEGWHGVHAHAGSPGTTVVVRQ
jgi:hypothetical protein